jgi:hypothetical protein
MSTTTVRVALRLYWDAYRFRREIEWPLKEALSAEKLEAPQARRRT